MQIQLMPTRFSFRHNFDTIQSWGHFYGEWQSPEPWKQYLCLLFVFYDVTASIAKCYVTLRRRYSIFWESMNWIRRNEGFDQVVNCFKGFFCNSFWTKQHLNMLRITFVCWRYLWRWWCWDVKSLKLLFSETISSTWYRVVVFLSGWTRITRWAI